MTNPTSTHFSSQNLITGTEGSSKNYIKGNVTNFNQIMSQVTDQLRLVSEKSDSPLDFVMTNSIVGATGSGTGDRISDILNINNKGSHMFRFNVFPSETNEHTIAPYNAVLGVSSQIDSSHALSINFENEKLFKMTSVSDPDYADINKIIALQMTNILAPIQAGLTNMDAIETSLRPYPRINFITPGYAPFVNQKCDSLTKAILYKNSSKFSSQFNGII